MKLFKKFILGSLLCSFSSFALTSDEVIRETGVDAGLCVVLGIGDGQLPLSLINNGKMLVHGLCLNESELAAPRAAALAVNRYGFVSYAKTMDPALLPYGENLVNLLVCEDFTTWSSRGLTENEIKRVLTPNGVAYIKKGTSFVKIIKARPVTNNDWGHWNLGPEGNQVSSDLSIGPITMLKWITFSGGTRIGQTEYQCDFVRVADGKMYHEWMSQWTTSNNYRCYLMGRDAYNGLSYWLRKMSIWQGNMAHDQAMVGGANKLFTVLMPGHYLTGGPLTALDGKTGKVVKEFTNLPSSVDKSDVNVVYVNGTVIGVSRNKIAAMDTTTWTEKWSFTETNGNLLFYPIASAEANKVWVVSGPRGAGDAWRVPYNAVHSIICLNLSTGAVVWRDNRYANYNCRTGCGKGQLLAGIMYRNGQLGAFGSANFGTLEQAKNYYYALFDANSGNMLWERNWENDPDSVFRKIGTLHQAFIRDDAVYLCAPQHHARLDKTNGRLIKFYDHISMSWGGGRCNKTVATDRYVIGGAVTYIDNDTARSSLLQEITRSNCAIGAFVANGLTYFNPAGCACFALLNGMAGFSSEPLPTFIPEANRLERGGPGALTKATTGLQKQVSFSPDGWTPSAQEIWRHDAIAPYTDWNKSPIAIDWLNNRRMNYFWRTDTLTADGIKYFASVHEHRLEAWNGTQKLWQFVADARITKAPVKIGTKLYFGCHDGYVYCLNAATGAQEWRFLAAPARSWVTAYGQLESQWPVFNVVPYGDRIYFTAGRHSELGGGIRVWGLDTKDQKVVLSTWIRYHRQWKKWIEIEKLDKNSKRTPTNNCLNEPLKLTDNVLSLPAFTYDLITNKMVLNKQAYNDSLYFHPVTIKNGQISSHVANIHLGHDFIELDRESMVTLTALDIKGRTIATLLKGNTKAGRTSFDAVSWQSKLKPGWYIISLNSSQGSVRRIVPVGLGD